MTTNDLIYASATTLALLIRRREVLAQDVVRAHLDRLAALNPLLNTVIQIAPVSAILQARAVDSAIAGGQLVGPLAGVPFTVKDVFAVKETARLVPIDGMPPLLALPDDHDSTAVIRLCQAGAILIGRTRATVWKDQEERYGPVHNPYDLTLDAHGSSGGEAATIAAGGSPLGLGSDSGGSLRAPAAACGILALRPSNGRVPRATDADGTNDPRTVAGPLARSVEDLAVAFDIIRGVDAFDPTTLPLPLGDWKQVEMRNLRVAVFSSYDFQETSQDHIDAVRRAAKALEHAGAHVEEIPPPDMEEAWNITLDYWRGTDGIGFPKEYDQFLARWDRFRIAMAVYMQNIDVIVCPVLTSVYPAFVSLLGWPSVTVPAGSPSVGTMPIGVQVVASPWRDDIALAAASTIESALGGWQREGLKV